MVTTDFGRAFVVLALMYPGTCFEEVLCVPEKVDEASLEVILEVKIEKFFEGLVDLSLPLFKTC